MWGRRFMGCWYLGRSRGIPRPPALHSHNNIVGSRSSEMLRNDTSNATLSCNCYNCYALIHQMLSSYEIATIAKHWYIKCYALMQLLQLFRIDKSAQRQRFPAKNYLALLYHFCYCYKDTVFISETVWVQFESFWTQYEMICMSEKLFCFAIW